MDVIPIRTSASNTSHHKGKHAKSKIVITAITGERLTNMAAPISNASVRGSEVTGDMAALTESVTSKDGTNQALSSVTSDVTTSKKKRRHPAKGTISEMKSGLDHDPVKVEEWLSLDKKALHPKYMSTRKHFLRIINTLDYDEKMVEVSNYMTVNDVVDLYLDYNIKCRDYIWKNIWAVELELNKTLEENKLIDKSEIIDEIGLDYFPTILLYFKDGFENEPKMELDISKHATPINSTLLAPPRNY